MCEHQASLELSEKTFQSVVLVGNKAGRFRLVEGPLYVPVSEAAIELGTTRQWVHSLVNRGVIEARRYRGRVWVGCESLYRYSGARACVMKANEGPACACGAPQRLAPG